MSYKLKLSAGLAVAVLTFPALAAAQDPSTRTDLTIVGAVLTDDSEQPADTNAVATPEMPVVHEDDAAAVETANVAEAETAAQAAAAE